MANLLQEEEDEKLDEKLLARVLEKITCVCEFYQPNSEQAPTKPVSLNSQLRRASAQLAALLSLKNDKFHSSPSLPQIEQQQQQEKKKKKNLQPPPSKLSVWSGFYQKTTRERHDVLSMLFPPAVMKTDAGYDWSTLGHLTLTRANLMIENCIGVLGIPLGLGLHFRIDEEDFAVPMAVEEPSVIAAASSAAKLIRTHAFGGGFQTSCTKRNIMTCQIQLLDLQSANTPQQPQQIMKTITAHKQQLLDFANTHLCPSMKKRGGGAVDLYCRLLPSTSSSTSLTSSVEQLELEIRVFERKPQQNMIVIHVDVDVCEAMGANIVNTVAEGLGDEILTLLRGEGRIGLKILTNLCRKRRCRAVFHLPVSKLGWKGVSGEIVADRIIEAANFALVDPYRAATHNKGILNGIDAVALATGQDWRAIEAAAHSFACCSSNAYKALSSYQLVTLSDQQVYLRGVLEIPIAVGTKGGALQTHPGYAATHAMLGNPSAQKLAAIMTCVGLAQNFAAVRALAITGIQKGHMALHARNIAVAAGAPSELVSELCSYMLHRQCIKVEAAREYLQAHHLFTAIKKKHTPPSSPKTFISQQQPSMFYVEIKSKEEGKENLSVNIAFERLFLAPNSPPENIILTSQSCSTTLRLLGDKGYNQLEKMMYFFSSMKIINSKESSRTNSQLQRKLVLISILINLISYRLMQIDSNATKSFIQYFLKCSLTSESVDRHQVLSFANDIYINQDIEKATVGVAAPLLFSLWQLFSYQIDQEVINGLLKKKILEEQGQLLDVISKTMTTSITPRTSDKSNVSVYLRGHSKRWQATMFLLVEALSLNEDVINESKLSFLCQMGEYLEWEGTVGHDLARYPRVLTPSTTDEYNSFICWLKDHYSESMKTNIEGRSQIFHQFAEEKISEMWHNLKSSQEPEHLIFQLSVLQFTAQRIRIHYNNLTSKNTRKYSF